MSSASSSISPTSPNQLNYQWIQKVYVSLDDYDRRILEESGLTTSEFRTLLSLDEREGERLTAISERLLLSKSTITRVIDQLEERTWVERIPDPNDRRALRVVLTEKGVEERQRISRAHHLALSQVFQQLEEEERKNLCLILCSLFEILQDSLNGNHFLLSEQTRNRSDREGGEST